MSGGSTSFLIYQPVYEVNSSENQELKVTVSNLQKSFNGKINELSKLKLHNNNAVRKNSEDKPSDRKGIVLEVKDRVETISAENKDSFANLRSKTVKNNKSLMVLANARKKMNINVVLVLVSAVVG